MKLKKPKIEDTTTEDTTAIVMTNNLNPKGVFKSRIYIDTGKEFIPGAQTAERKTLKSAIKWAKKILTLEKGGQKNDHH